MTLIWILSDAWSYVKNGLPSVSFTEVAAFCGILLAVAKGIEQLTGKKYIGTWAWAGLKRFGSSPYKMVKSIEEMKTDIKHMRSELITNGGSTVKDMSISTNQLAISTNLMVKALRLNMRVSEEIDSMMKFEATETGAWDWANRAFYNYFNFKESDVKGFNYESFIDKRDLKDVQLAWTRAVETKSDFNYTYGIKTRGGKVIQCQVEGVPLLDNGTLCGYKGIITPICDDEQLKK